MHIKKSLVLLITVVLVLSCNQDEVLDQNTTTADLTSDISQYDNSNLGLYKGTFTTNDGSERGLVEVKILDNVPSRATLTLSSGAIYNLQSTKTVTSGQDITNLNFVTITDQASPVRFDFSVTAGGSSVDITNTTFGALESDIMIAKETSRGPVTGITGTYLCTDCGTHPTLGTVVQTFNLMYVGPASGFDSMTTQISLSATTWTSTAVENSQGNCVTNANAEFNDCPITGSTTVNPANIINWSGTHTYNTSATNCSQVSGSWTYVSPAYGSLAGTFTSDSQCLPATSVGDIRAGGIVFWVDPADNTHGLVCTLSDYVSLEQWGCFNTDLPSVPNVNINPPTGPGAEIGDGISNTNSILTDCLGNTAASAVRSLGPEWFLPSAKELNEMYVNKASLEAVPGFTPFQQNFYWSSTESDAITAWGQNFGDGIQSVNVRIFSYDRIRAVRAF